MEGCAFSFGFLELEVANGVSRGKEGVRKSWERFLEEEFESEVILNVGGGGVTESSEEC